MGAFIDRYAGKLDELTEDQIEALESDPEYCKICEVVNCRECHCCQCSED